MTRCKVCFRPFQYWCHRGICQHCCRRRACAVTDRCGPRKYYMRKMRQHRKEKIIQNPSQRVADFEDSANEALS